MVFMRLDDVTGGAECVVFNSVYAQSRELCTVDRILVVKGRIDHKEGESKLLAAEVQGFEAVPEKREVRLKIDAVRARAGVIRELRALVERYPGDALVYAELQSTIGPRTLQFGPGYKVHADSDFFTEVRELLGPAAL
jgi:DNA polymerase-3 subunit alpha